MTFNYEEYKKRYFKEHQEYKNVKLTQDNDICEFVKVIDIDKSKNTQFLRLWNFKHHNMIIHTSHKYSLYIMDENGNEIPDNTKIRVVKEKLSEYITSLANIDYSNIKNGYTFSNVINVPHEVYVGFTIINPENNIPKENIKFSFEFDYWIPK